MKIDMENVFIGTIRRCTKYNTHTTFSSSTYIGDDCIGEDSFGYIEYDSIVRKENAKLLKVTQGGYVDLDYLNNLLDELKVKSKITRNGFYTNGLIMSTSPGKSGDLFVDVDTLKKYEPLKEIKRPTVKKLKKTMLMDARVPGGIEW